MSNGGNIESNFFKGKYFQLISSNNRVSCVCDIYCTKYYKKEAQGLEGLEQDYL